MRRPLAAPAAGLLAGLLFVTAILLGLRLSRTQADLRALQATAAQQRSQLKAMNAQADALAGQLRAVQRQNAEIRRLIGGERSRSRTHGMLGSSRRIGSARDFAALQARLRRLAAASRQTSADTARLQRLALRVVNVRRLAAVARERLIAAIPSIVPVPGAEIAAGFGWRTDPWPEFHKGVDLAADSGTPVLAAAAGVVVSAGWDDGGFGNKVDIDHGNGYHTWYAHLSRIAVSAGTRVTKGERIAFVGSTGESTGPHLHYQVMHDGEAVDPQPFLSGVPAKVLATLSVSGGV